MWNEESRNVIGDVCDVRMKPVNAMIVKKKHKRNLKYMLICMPGGQPGLESLDCVMITGIWGECQAIFSKSEVCLKKSRSEIKYQNVKVKIDLF